MSMAQQQGRFRETPATLLAIESAFDNVQKTPKRSSNPAKLQPTPPQHKSETKKQQRMTIRLLQNLRNSSHGSPASGFTKPTLAEAGNDPTEGTVDEAAESLETVVVELQHDLRAKSAQCDVLRDTLSAMSKQLKEQESNFIMELQKQEAQFEKLTEELTKQKRFMSMKQASWDKNVEKFEDLLDEKEEECAEWKAKFDDLMLQMEEREQAQVTQAQDPLLGDILNAPQSGSLSLDSIENVLRKRAEGAATDDDSIQDQYSALGTAERPAAFTNRKGELSPPQSPTFTNRTRPYRRKKRGHPIKKFKIMPMNWIGNTGKQANLGVSESVIEEDPEQEFNDQMESMSLADMYTDDDSNHLAGDSISIPSVVSNEASKNYNAERRRRRVRRAAKKKSLAQGFGVEQLEC